LITTSKIGVGEGSNRVGVVEGTENEGEADSVAVRDRCVVMSVGESPKAGTPRGTQAVQRTRMERKINDFKFVITRLQFIV